MSKETTEWLNANTMLGFTTHREKYAHLGWGTNFNEKTGQNEAWWHTDDFKNGYPDAIPASEVERVLFNWVPIETEIMYKRRDGITADNMDAADSNGPFVWLLLRKIMLPPPPCCPRGSRGVLRSRRLRCRCSP